MGLLSRGSNPDGSLEKRFFPLFLFPKINKWLILYALLMYLNYSLAFAINLNVMNQEGAHQ